MRCALQNLLVRAKMSEDETLVGLLRPRRIVSQNDGVVMSLIMRCKNECDPPSLSEGA